MSPRLTAAALGVGLLTAVPVRAHAQITLVGATGGCFYTGTTACTNYQTSAAQQNLTFAGRAAGTTFGSTSGGMLNNIDLGSFTLSSSLYSLFAGRRFALNVAFTQPGSATSATQATLWGLSVLGTGGIYIDFGGAAQRVTYSNASGSGEFFLRVDSPLFLGNITALRPSDTRTITADVTGATFVPNVTANVVPEPGTYALLGAGLAALVGAVHRRRTALKA